MDRHLTREELAKELFHFILDEAKKGGGGEKAAGAVFELVAETFDGVRDCFDGIGGAGENFKAGWRHFADVARKAAEEL
jgi:hypothetical protein